MLCDQQSRDLRNPITQFKFARAGVRRQLALLQHVGERPLHLPTAVTAALEIAAFGAGYTAVTALEPGPGLDADTCDLFRTSAHAPWEAWTEPATDLARLLGGFIAAAAAHLELLELTAAVPTLRAALFVQAQRHFAQDCDLNPPLIQHWCDGLDTALKQGEPITAILCLRALRDRLLAGTAVGTGPATAGAPDDPGDDWRRHDPGPSSDNSTDAQAVSGTVLSCAHVSGTSKDDKWPPEAELVIERGVPIPTLEEEEALARLSRRRDDLLISPAPDPVLFALVTRHIRQLTDHIAQTKGRNVANRRAALHLIPRTD